MHTLLDASDVNLKVVLKYCELSWKEVNLIGRHFIAYLVVFSCQCVHSRLTLLYFSVSNVSVLLHEISMLYW